YKNSLRRYLLSYRRFFIIEKIYKRRFLDMIRNKKCWLKVALLAAFFLSNFLTSSMATQAEEVIQEITVMNNS
ncbi:hypothetical protein, partial [Enterococcus faecium]|uniref:hypothetical protein n=1 Tax=Enterococcus faecium TaxID=1352 RepID=UPI001E577644